MEMTTARASSRPKIGFADLPSETQHNIFSHCSQSDLICLALVSKHFHELASVVLYRNFNIVFPDEDESEVDSPIDSLAGGLDTFATSPHNYARHLRNLSMDTLSAGDKGEQSYQSYLYNTSCGKFLNTLLWLTLKNARGLETFRWNIRVELSRPVYQVLHRISSLRKLHLRMQYGQSYYIPPPPLPVTSVAHGATYDHEWAGLLTTPPSADDAVETVLAAMPPPIPSGPPASLGTAKSLPRRKSSKRGWSAQPLLTIGGFKNLQSLAVLDIDKLDVASELKMCLKNSSSTLKELSLSFSACRAMLARKPPSDNDAELSEDDEYQDPFADSASAKPIRVSQERRMQEALLGQIFDVEPLLSKKPHLRQTASNATTVSLPNGQVPAFIIQDPGMQFISSIRYVSKRLLTLMHGSEALSGSQQEILATIETAARHYIQSITVPLEPDGTCALCDCGAECGPGPSTEAGAAAPLSSNSGNTVAQQEAVNNTAANSTVEQGTSSSPFKVKRPTGEMVPEDIDVERLDGADEVLDENEDQQFVAEAERGTSGETGPAALVDAPTTSEGSTQQMPRTEAAAARLQDRKERLQTLTSRLNSFQDLADNMRGKIQQMRAQGEATNTPQVRLAEAQHRIFVESIEMIQVQIREMQVNMEEFELQLPDDLTEGATKRNMQEYVRKTRGFALESLSIHLIPVRASVLSQAINLWCLKKLTLLNVGNQAPIWTLLARENRLESLPLRSVFTDNVSNATLTCLGQLKELHELFLLHRPSKSKPECLAPVTPIMMDQIRRLVLKKHMGTLQRLMIKDEQNAPDWDANEKTMILICTRGKELKELAVSMNIHAIHAFMQYFSGLVNLRAINILRFRNNDTCIWVMREILRFIVDNLSHYPELKLTWIAMEDERVARVMRPEDPDSDANSDAERRKQARKGKQKAEAPAIPPIDGPLPPHGLPWLPSEGLESDSDTDDDEPVYDTGDRLRYKTVGPLRFYDVWGIKIFEKEYRSGKL
ncbi:hypothetical protein B0I35DRAFT_472781 [Stachybotrys elegans]|uniref:F-box domain-containing protein n=1 Tax=Stachybotrys elegans TaxID=80388 RepID=A0A8K0SXQ1_9HYPO|nr:hypothetical protein B0I35DRAFT_472781 [Stachybotrys elegans]